MSGIWEYILLWIVILIVLLIITIWIECFAKSLFDIVLFGTITSLGLWGIVLWNNIFEDTFYTLVSSVGFLICFSILKILLTVRDIPCHRSLQFV